jgi:DNA-binding NtrC family response regulator
MLIEIERLLDGVETFEGMIYRSEAMRHIVRMVERVAPTPTSVIIQGESGTGKELVARAMHTLSDHPRGPMIVFNCANLVESMADAQLFGHVRGAFTDAREDSLGYFRAADGGTLFLDEIGELPASLQPKLLRAIETSEIQPVGSARTFKIKVRIVVATNRDLGAITRQERFRADLYYRLGGMIFCLPPLRRRPEAIPALCGHFLREYSKLLAHPVRHISSAALNILCAHDWPGNIRQLAHAMESAVISAEGDIVGPAELPRFLFESKSGLSDLVSAAPQLEPVSPIPTTFPSLKSSLAEMTRQAVERALMLAHGNRSRTASALGISRPKLYRLLERYALHQPMRAHRVARSAAVFNI